MLRVTAWCPATTANLGPGFDCLAMALDLWNGVVVVVVGEGEGEASLTVTAEGAEGKGIPLDQTNLLVQTARHAYGLPSFPSCHFHLINQIPVGRGLGSSAAAVVLGLVVGRLLRDPATPPRLEEVLDMASQIEGHADNAAAAIFGSVQLCFRVMTPAGRTWDHRPIPPHPNFLQAQAGICLCIPDEPSLTSEGRLVLDKEVGRDVAVFNAGRVGLLVAAILQGNLGDLAEASRDMLHQPRRSVLFPHLGPLLEGVGRAGGWAGWLSGAGSTVALLGPSTARARLEEACSRPGARALWTQFTPKGVLWKTGVTSP